MNKEYIIVEARNEYIRQLNAVLINLVFEKFMSIYSETYNSCKYKQDVLINFQRSLKNVPLWNQNQIDEATKEITSKCDYIENLIAAIFISNVKILSSVKIGKVKKQINVTMPKIDQFIHSMYSSCAESLYNNYELFSVKKYGTEVGIINKYNIIDVLKVAIEETIRNILPFQNILENTLNNQDSDTESDTSNVNSDSDNDEEPHDEEPHDEEPQDEEPQDEEQYDEEQYDEEPHDEEQYDEEPHEEEQYDVIDQENTQHFPPVPQQKQQQEKPPSFFASETKNVQINPNANRPHFQDHEDTENHFEEPHE